MARGCSKLDPDSTWDSSQAQCERTQSALLAASLQRRRLFARTWQTWQLWDVAMPGTQHAAHGTLPRPGRGCRGACSGGRGVSLKSAAFARCWDIPLGDSDRNLSYLNILKVAFWVSWLLLGSCAPVGDEVSRQSVLVASPTPPLSGHMAAAPLPALGSNQLPLEGSGVEQAAAQARRLQAQKRVVQPLCFIVYPRVVDRFL